MAEFNEQSGGHDSVGERLRRAREAKGMSLEEVATQTRIPVRHPRAIEDGHWEALPAVTYSVGFARAYGNAVGLDGSAIGREIRDQLGGHRPPTSAPEYYEPADPARVPPRPLLIVTVLLATLLLGGYLFWRSGLSDEQPEVVATQAAPAQQTQTAPPPPPQPAVPTGQVTLVATDEVWLRIDGAASGGALFQGILTAGQRYDVPATAEAPVLRTGRPQVLRVTIGGRDLGPLAPEERTVSNVSLRAADLAARLQPAGAATPIPVTSG